MKIDGRLDAAIHADLGYIEILYGLVLNFPIAF